MRVLVISDTHIPQRAKDLPREIWEMAQKVDMIVHAGDFTKKEVLVELRSVNPEVKAVWGNMDEPKLVEMLPEKVIFEIEGKKIGLTHGSGAPWRIEKRVMDKFKDEKLDVLIFGHSHQALIKREKDLLLFNPGTPTDRIFSRRLTYGILDITGGEIKVEIVPLEESARSSKG